MELPQNIFIKFKVFKVTRDRIASIGIELWEFLLFIWLQFSLS